MSRKSITVSAPGKFHLIGEHSSVYARPAILCAIDKRVTVKLTVTSQDNFSGVDSSVSKTVNAIRIYIQKKYKVAPLTVSLTISSDLPIGQGLGSSAALSAALANAFFHLYGLKFDLSEIYDAAYQGEKVFHGNPSGGDLAAVVYGGVVWFRKETESVKLFKKMTIPATVFRQLLLINSGKPVESTKKMVEMVGRKNMLDAALILKFNDSQEMLTKILSDSLKQQDMQNTFSIIKKAEANLEAIGVVGQKAIKMRKKLEKSGAAVKISGGGGIEEGSGMMVAMCSDKKKTISLCRENNWEFLPVKLSEEGVRVEK